ncbi:hypothetical protein [Micrococcus luteus]|uniref:hypothetical protein n=1 Tax=Micrococcus luteus TaxID=1270 RepID=UPI0023045F3F|nr:hypothetical protein [Micrococcus luteus]
MNEKRSLLNGNAAMFSQHPTPTPAAQPAPQAAPAAQTAAPAAVKKAPRQQVKFYAGKDAYEAFKRAHRILQVHDDSLGSMSDHLSRLMVQETERVNRKHGAGEDRDA